MTSVHLTAKVLGTIVACKSIHPPWHFSFFVALKPGIKMYFGGVCVIVTAVVG
jgi:hypothetical protein